MNEQEIKAALYLYDRLNHQLDSMVGLIIFMSMSVAVLVVWTWIDVYKILKGK